MAGTRKYERGLARGRLMRIRNTRARPTSHRRLIVEPLEDRRMLSVGGVAWSTYLGGSGIENESNFEGRSAVDRAGNTFVTGATSSIDFAGAKNSALGRRDAYVAKVSP